jgi:hypothetical protein
MNNMQTQEFTNDETAKEYAVLINSIHDLLTKVAWGVVKKKHYKRELNALFNKYPRGAKIMELPKYE